MSAKRKIRTTLVLEGVVLNKLKQKSEGNISELANKILKKALFSKGESMFGELKGVISTKDVRKEEAHEDLYR